MLFPGERSTLSSEAAALARSRRENSPEMGWSEMAVAPSGGVKDQYGGRTEDCSLGLGPGIGMPGKQFGHHHTYLRSWRTCL